MKIYSLYFYRKRNDQRLKKRHESSGMLSFNLLSLLLSRLKNRPFARIHNSLALIGVFFLFAPTGVSAQQVTIKRDKVPLERILKDFEDQTDYVFFYKKNEIEVYKSVSLDVSALPTSDALQKLFTGLDLDFEVFDKTIAIKRKAKPKVAPKVTTHSGRKISGMVVDENELAIKGAKVKEVSWKSWVVTDSAGRFQLPVAEKGTLEIEVDGFAHQIVHYSDTTEKYIVMKKGKDLSIELDDVSIKYDQVKKNPTQFVDLNNRSYMNLSQVLQGTIPGLSLQTVNTNSVNITSIEVYQRASGRYIRMSEEEFRVLLGSAAQRIIDDILSGKEQGVAYRINTSTSVTNTLVPQIRGANNFIAQNSSMLVVIDGFPQEGFPADYPMMNVESIEVIKDPKELIKWGASAAGGAIMIKTKGAKKGRISVGYSSNFYYSAAPSFDREKLQLASPAEYLRYVREMDSVYQRGYTANSLNLGPAQEYLSQRKLNLITQAQFNQKWDSLSRLDNQEQLAMLRQDRFGQSHNLTLSGGSDIYRFTLLGNYVNDRTNVLNNKTQSIAINLNNDFSFFKKKLQIKWLVNFSNDRTTQGFAFDPATTTLAPYQMLLDANGNYVYDYSSALSESANNTIMGYGYKNYGVNLLEDALVNQNTSLSNTKKTSLNATWNLLPGLNWGTSLYYTSRKIDSDVLYGQESSYVRQLVDQYGELNGNSVNFYVPYGDILQQNGTNYQQYNVRTSLSYTKQLGKHGISLGIGAGAASTLSSRPASSTLYGYNSTTETATPIYLPTPTVNASITNFYSLLPGNVASISPYTLTVPVNGDTTLSRNINANASLGYKFSEYFTANAVYNRVLSPVAGQDPPYSVMENLNGDITAKIIKNAGKIISGIYVSAGINKMKMPDMPVQYYNLRYQQANYNNYAIWVTGLNPTQQQGQTSTNIYQRLTMSVLDSTIKINAAYNQMETSATLQTNQSVNNGRKTNFISAGIEMSFRKHLLNFKMDYSKSPEGLDQLNGSLRYDISKERYFYSNTISGLEFSATLQNISPYQGLGLMMGTNISSSGSFSQANVSNFNSLPPNNTNFEVRGRIAMSQDRYNLDIRYYNQTSAGLNNYVAVAADPATGVGTQTSYSNITNKGIEFFLKTDVYRNTNFSYSVTLNGAYNRNVASNVPSTGFVPTLANSTTARNGYDISGVWTLPWAGLSATGEPQYYDALGNLSSDFDSAAVASSLVYAGVTKAPWTGGLIHELRYKAFFLRASIVFNLGYLMRYYIPYINGSTETSALIADRWRQPGDEQFTDVAAPYMEESNSYRQFVAQYSSNSLLSADNIRLQEIMVGVNVPTKLAKKYGLGSLTLTCSVQNIFTWTKNEYNIDPVTVGMNGRAGLSMPRQYSMGLSLNF